MLYDRNARVKAVSWDWQSIQTDYDDTARCYKLTDRQIAALLIPLIQATWRTRWFNQPENFDTILEWVNDCQAALMLPADCDSVPCPPLPPLPEDELHKYICSVIEIENEDLYDMGRLTIEVLQGVAYLVDDCGCGNLKRYRLQEAQVDPVTGAIGSAIDQIPDSVPAIDAQGNDSCYYSAAANVICDQISNFVDGLAGYFLTGVFQATIGAAVEVQQVVNAILTGTASLNFDDLGVTASEVKAALTTSGYKAWVADKLAQRNLNSGLTRWNLARLTQLEVPQSFNVPTPITPYINWYGLSANLGTLNSALSQAASQCAGGVQPASGLCWELDLTQYASIEDAGLVTNGDASYLPYEGLYTTSVGGQIFVGYEGLGGKQVTKIGFKSAEPLNAGAFLRLDYSITPVQQTPPIAVGGQSDTWVNAAATINPASERYVWFFNGLNSAGVITHLRIQFVDAQSPNYRMYTIDCPT